MKLIKFCLHDDIFALKTAITNCFSNLRLIFIERSGIKQAMAAIQRASYRVYTLFTS